MYSRACRLVEFNYEGKRSRVPDSGNLPRFALCFCNSLSRLPTVLSLNKKTVSSTIQKSEQQRSTARRKMFNSENSSRIELCEAMRVTLSKLGIPNGLCFY